MNYRSLSDSELERRAYATGSFFAQSELAERATDAVEAYEENERIITEMEDENEDYCGKYLNLLAFLKETIRPRVVAVSDLLYQDHDADAERVLDAILDAIDAETSL